MSEYTVHPQAAAASDTEEISFDQSVCSAEFAAGCTEPADEQ